MKHRRFNAIVILVVIVAFISFGGLYMTRESRAALICTSLDDSIRPRNYCLMNPFRDRKPEAAAEAVLAELRSGNADSIRSLVRGDAEVEKRFFERESEYRVTSWRIGDRTQTSDKLSLHYWVRRANYPDIEESVGFFFARSNGEWRLEQFTATY